MSDYYNQFKNAIIQKFECDKIEFPDWSLDWDDFDSNGEHLNEDLNNLNIKENNRYISLIDKTKLSKEEYFELVDFTLSITSGAQHGIEYVDANYLPDGKYEELLMKNSYMYDLSFVKKIAKNIPVDVYTKFVKFKSFKESISQ